MGTVGSRGDTFRNSRRVERRTRHRGQRAIGTDPEPEDLTRSLSPHIEELRGGRNRDRDTGQSDPHRIVHLLERAAGLHGQCGQHAGFGFRHRHAMADEDEPAVRAHRHATRMRCASWESLPIAERPISSDGEAHHAAHAGVQADVGDIQRTSVRRHREPERIVPALQVLDPAESAIGPNAIDRKPVSAVVGHVDGPAVRRDHDAARILAAVDGIADPMQCPAVTDLERCDGAGIGAGHVDGGHRPVIGGSRYRPGENPGGGKGNDQASGHGRPPRPPMIAEGTAPGAETAGRPFGCP